MVDSSVLANALVGPASKGDGARQRLTEDPDLHAPQLMDAEVVAAIRRMVSSGELDEEIAVLALVDLQEMAVVRYPHVELIPRMWELRDNATPHDASYIALAEELHCPLITADAHLAEVPSIRCRVEVVR